MRGSGAGGLLVFITVLFGIAYYGPVLATDIANSVVEMVQILAPVVGPILGVTLVVLVVRYYWSRF